jgi:4'-phosphopantetheinyl transferase
MTGASSALGASDVRVFFADVAALAASGSRVDRWRGWLTPDERRRYERFHHDSDRMLFVCGRGMARELVGRALGVTPDGWTWREGPHGRPEIGDPATPLRFNVAHTAGLIVCGLARGRDVGVDVEDRERRPVERGVVRRYCSPAEAADIDAQGDAGWHDRFLQYWTLKEAYLKARGLGIAVPLADISFTLNGNGARISFLGALASADADWTLTMFRPSPRHVAAVAAQGHAAAVIEEYGDGPVFHRSGP